MDILVLIIETTSSYIMNFLCHDPIKVNRCIFISLPLQKLFPRRTDATANEVSVMGLGLGKPKQVFVFGSV